MSDAASANNLLTIPEVAAETRHSAASVRRWISGGVLVGGWRVKLAQHRVGGRVYVSRAALEAFHRACNPGAVPVPGNPAKELERGRLAQERLAKRLQGIA